MRIDLTTDIKDRDAVHIHVNGRLACEVAVGRATTRDDMLGRIAAARTLHALPGILRGIMGDLARVADMPDHIHTTPEKRREACLRGLVDGFDGRTVPYPGGALIPPVPPDSTPSYSRGYQMGEALARCAKGEGVAALVREPEAPEGRVA